MVVGSSPVAVTENSDFTPASSKKFLDIQATIECGLTLKRVRDMIRTYSQLKSNVMKVPTSLTNFTGDNQILMFEKRISNFYLLYYNIKILPIF